MNYKYERLPDSDITATIPTTTHDNRQPVFEYHSIFQYSKSSQITLNDTEDGTAVYVGEEEGKIVPMICNCFFWFFFREEFSYNDFKLLFYKR